jgi:hypothetical protein
VFTKTFSPDLFVNLLHPIPGHATPFPSPEYHQPNPPSNPAPCHGSFPRPEPRDNTLPKGCYRHSAPLTRTQKSMSKVVPNVTAGGCPLDCPQRSPEPVKKNQLCQPERRAVPLTGLLGLAILPSYPNLGWCGSAHRFTFPGSQTCFVSGLTFTFSGAA